MALSKDNFKNIYNENDKIAYYEKTLNEGKSSHAYLLCGSPRSKKIDFAYYIAIRGLNALDTHLEELILKDEFQNVIYITSENNIITKDKIISLQEELNNTSLVDGKRYYIINGADKLNVQSANSLLKFIEEPNSDVTAILICENLDKVLDTIKSRCQILYFKDDLNEDIAKKLQSDDDNLRLLVTYLDLSLDEMQQALDEGWPRDLLDALKRTFKAIKEKSVFDPLFKDMQHFMNDRTYMGYYLEMLIVLFSNIYEGKIVAKDNLFDIDLQAFTTIFEEKYLEEVLFKLHEFKTKLDFNCNVGLIRDLLFALMEAR